jgi:hypothetical protein
MDILGISSSPKSVSMLELWVYENRGEEMTFTEQLERKKRDGEAS